MLYEFSSQALTSVRFIGHDRAELDVILHDAVLHELHPVGGNVREDLAVLNE